MNALLLLITIVSVAITTAAVIVALRAANENARRSQARVLALAADIHGRDSFNPLPQPGPGRSLRSRGLMIGAASAFLLGAAALTLSRLPIAPSQTTSPEAPPSRTVTNPDGPALELVDLSHVSEKDGFRVTGRIHNPDRATIRQDLSVVVLLFDAGGLFLGSAEGDAGEPLLEPGATATFAVTIQTRTAPARYRVSFRQGTSVVPHVDKRGDQHVTAAVPAHTEPRSGRWTS